MAPPPSKKRATPSSGAGKASKKLKLANKASSSKSSTAAKQQAKQLKSNGFQKKQKDAVETISSAPAASSLSNKGKGKGKPAETEKKEKKNGKNGVLRQFVEMPGQLKTNQKRREKEVRNGGSSSEGTSDQDVDEDDDDDDESMVSVDDMMPEVDEDDEAASGDENDSGDFESRAAFLKRLDTKGLSRTRSSLKQEHRLSRPTAPTDHVARHKTTLPKIGPAAVKTNEDDEEDFDALSEDDFAKMGSDDNGDSEDWGDSEDDALSVMSGAEGESMEDFSDDDLDDEDLEDGDESLDTGAHSAGLEHGSDDEDLEDRYATLAASRARHEAKEAALRGPSRLPTFANGQMNDAQSKEEAAAAENRVSRLRAQLAEGSSSEDEDSSEDEATRKRKERQAQPKPNPYGARYGRPAVTSVLEIEDRMERLTAAREELASLGREIIAEPELGMNLLKRLLSFTLPYFPTAESSKKKGGDPGLPVDMAIRSLAMLSLLAVFIDILPGYRIRSVGEKEKNQKTTQAVIQQREYEEALVGAYRKFLELCEGEINYNYSEKEGREREGKTASPLAPIATKVLCELMKEKAHFNYSSNIIEVLVKYLGRQTKSTTAVSSSTEMILASLSSVMAQDPSGSYSHTIVHTLSRSIKARSYLVHPAILSCLLDLRFPDLGATRAGTDRISRDDGRKRDAGWGGKSHFDRAKKRKEDKDKPHMNKKARKALNEKKEIAKEFKEAEMEVKTEERMHNSTETLKLLFALYFRILKLPVGDNNPLLPSALEGLARFSSLINVDFFRDLLGVLKGIMLETKEERIALLCIATSLELLSGQGEALNIDLTAFITHLYTLLLPLTLSATFEARPPSAPSLHLPRSSFSTLSASSLLFLCLSRIFLTSRLPNPPLRSLSFTKRLLISSLHWPKDSAIATLNFLKALILKERKLEALLNSEDRKRDGRYRYEFVGGDESLAGAENALAWELGLLEQNHYDDEVREKARELAGWSKDS